MRVPAPWQDLLLSIRSVCPSAVLAGGALRDLWMERPIKDLDIFIEAGSMQRAEEAISALTEAGHSVIFEQSDLTAYPEDQNLEVVAVASLIRFGTPVQLIFTNWPIANIMDRFDYGICQVVYDGETVTFGPHFAEDEAAQVFRLRRDRPTPMSMRGSVHRYARLLDKYPGWTWWPYDEPLDFAFA